ncbi:MAG: hypothetical protein V4539_01160 [Bacteroidota bacterium]
MEQNQPLEVVEQQFQFEMTVACGDELFACRVFSALQPDGTRFTRVLYNAGVEERTIDVAYWEEEGWIDMWYGEPSPWSALVAPALDYHFAIRKKA